MWLGLSPPASALLMLFLLFLLSFFAGDETETASMSPPSELLMPLEKEDLWENTAAPPDIPGIVAREFMSSLSCFTTQSHR